MRISRLIGRVVAAALLAGCSAAENPDKSTVVWPDAEHSMLVDVFKKVSDSAAQERIDYLDLRTARGLVAKDKSGMYKNLWFYYVHDFYAHVIPEDDGGYDLRPTLKGTYGYDEKDVDTAVSVGVGGNYLTGRFDKKAIAESSAAGDWHDLVGDNALYRSLGQPTGKTLADDPAHVAVANCLGDVYEASFGPKYPEKSNALLTAVGGRITSSGTPISKICALAHSRRTANTMAKEMRRDIANYPGAEVTIGKGDTPMVTMAWRNKPKPGLRPGDQTEYAIHRGGVSSRALDYGR
ncbi:hypothetical protein ACIBK8_29810 [Streptomyces sp. NPDC050161]|uniref:hypothetical protein n=1 Tax=Streptomyces sp. NPDC050161 TaxID=3365604 RepID=UPI00378A9AD2